MCRRMSIWAVVACVPLSLANTGWTQVPQTIGMPDVAFSGMTEADCRVCHDSGLPDRHHLLYGDPIPPGSLVPYPDADGDGNPDPVYVCLSCHDDNFTVVRDCLSCHAGDSPHHTGGSGCAGCHGSVVDLSGAIPTYAPSLVTPSPGDCANCHVPGGSILSNMELHHGTGLGTTVGCDLCHDMTLPDDEKIRKCGDCHGLDSLHNIQADSAAPGNIGTIVVGGEDAGYGHVGRDAGPGDSDCWGCHGFAGSAFSPLSGPIAPTVSKSHPAVAKAGTDILVMLTGSAFSNTAGEALFESHGVLTAADGSSVSLTPVAIHGGLLAAIIPASTAPGNYKLQAVKTNNTGKPVASNPAAISIVPEVIITDVTTVDGIMTIKGGGFAGYAEGSGTSVTGAMTTGEDKTAVEATIVSWNDTIIKADFGGTSPKEVTVNSVFGSATYEIVGKPN